MEHLPNEILLQIFNYLDPNTLKNVSKICERFQYLIHNSTKLMSKFKILISLSSLNSKKTISSDMPFRRFEINTNQYYRQLLLKTFESRIKLSIEDYIENIDNLKIINITTALASGILVDLQNLTHLTIENIQKSGNEEDDAEYSIKLPNLKVLEVDGVDTYLKCLKTPNIETLTFRSKAEFNSSLPQDSSKVDRSLNNFLKRSPKLKNFTLDGNTFVYARENFTFMLEKLTFKSFSSGFNKTNENPIVEMMRSQSTNVKDLTVITYLTRDILQVAVNEMKKLEKLKIDLEKIFSEPQGLNINNRIKVLEFINMTNYESDAVEIIQKCKAVEVLKIHAKISQNFLGEISKSMKNLRCLIVKSIDGTDKAVISLKNLKYFEILELTSKQEFLNLLKVCQSAPNLYELKISKLVPMISCGTFKKLLNKTGNMRILRMRGNFIVTKDIIQILLECETNLKLLWLDVDIYRDTKKLISHLHSSNIQCIIPNLNCIENLDNFDRDDSLCTTVYSDGSTIISDDEEFSVEVFEESYDQDDGSDDDTSTENIRITLCLCDGSDDDCGNCTIYSEDTDDNCSSGISEEDINSEDTDTKNEDFVMHQRNDRQELNGESREPEDMESSIDCSEDLNVTNDQNCVIFIDEIEIDQNNDYMENECGDENESENMENSTEHSNDLEVNLNSDDEDECGNTDQIEEEFKINEEIEDSNVKSDKSTLKSELNINSFKNGENSKNIEIFEVKNIKNASLKIVNIESVNEDSKHSAHELLNKAEENAKFASIIEGEVQNSTTGNFQNSEGKTSDNTQLSPKNSKKSTSHFDSSDLNEEFIDNTHDISAKNQQNKSQSFLNSEDNESKREIESQNKRSRACDEENIEIDDTEIKNFHKKSKKIRHE